MKKTNSIRFRCSVIRPPTRMRKQEVESASDDSHLVGHHSHCNISAKEVGVFIMHSLLRLEISSEFSDAASQVNS